MITTYQYSKAHNRTQKVKDGVTSDYSYNNLNQLTRFTEPGRQVYFYYDDNGNRIRRTENGVVDTYAYDYENRLVSLQQGDVPYAYTYDYRTRRVERVEGDTRTKIVFSGGTSVQEYEAVPCEEGGAGGQESGSSGGQGCEELKVEYIRGSDYGGGIGGILYTLRESVPSYTHYNNRGDVVAKTDDEQAVTYQATYEAFGTRTHEVGETQDRQKANTKDEDPTGLLNEGFRYRDLETGCFITRDPLGHKEGPNFYTYVHQNPWTKFDPEGLAEKKKEEPPPPVPQLHLYGRGSLESQIKAQSQQLMKQSGLPVTANVQFHSNLFGMAMHQDTNKGEASMSFNAFQPYTHNVKGGGIIAGFNADFPLNRVAPQPTAQQLQTMAAKLTPVSNTNNKTVREGELFRQQHMAQAPLRGGEMVLGMQSGLWVPKTSNLRGFVQTHSGKEGQVRNTGEDVKALQNISKSSGGLPAYGYTVVPTDGNPGHANVYSFTASDPAPKLWLQLDYTKK